MNFNFKGDGIDPVIDGPILEQRKECPKCHSTELYWFCIAGTCNCEDSLNEGLCDCDQWVCASCGYCLTKPFEGKYAIIENGHVVSIIP